MDDSAASSSEREALRIELAAANRVNPADVSDELVEQVAAERPASAACGCRTPEDCKGPDTPNCEYARAMVEKHGPPVTQRFELRLLLPAHWRVTQADGVAARLIDEFLPSSVGVVREGGDDGRPVTHREVADDD